MENLKKGKILLLIVILLSISIILVVYIKDKNQSKQLNLESGENINNLKNQQEKIIKIEGTKMLGNIEISNIQIKLVQLNQCEVTANVRNTSEGFLETTNVELIVINENGN